MSLPLPLAVLEGLAQQGELFLSLYQHVCRQPFSSAAPRRGHRRRHAAPPGVVGDPFTTPVADAKTGVKRTGSSAGWTLESSPPERVVGRPFRLQASLASALACDNGPGTPPFRR
ncbi:hypothetical protein GCM10027186_37580 [Micromonospora schwarzwaldensis]